MQPERAGLGSVVLSKLENRWREVISVGEVSKTVKTVISAPNPSQIGIEILFSMFQYPLKRSKWLYPRPKYPLKVNFYLKSEKVAISPKSGYFTENHEKSPKL